MSPKLARTCWIREAKTVGGLVSLVCLLAGATGAPTAAISSTRSVQLYSVSHPAMDTTYSLFIYAPSQSEAEDEAESAFEEIYRLDDLLSNYRESSKISRINRDAAAYGVTTDPETFHFLQTLLAWSERSEKHFINDGHLYCHIMDPHTLHPVEGMLQVSVMAPSVTDSDALSNVLFVLGPKRGVSVMRQVPEDSALVIAGNMQAPRCETVRWTASIRSGFCTKIETAKESR